MASPTVHKTDRTKRPNDPIVVKTEFTIDAIWKGDKTVRKFTLSHYEYNDLNSHITVVDGAGYLRFGKNDSQPYLMFLRQVKDIAGEYVPCTGQYDPGVSIRVLNFASTTADKKAKPMKPVLEATGDGLKVGADEPKLSKGAEAFLVSTKEGFTDFSLYVLFFEPGVEESNWAFVRQAPPSAQKSKTAVLSSAEARKMIECLQATDAFLREPVWPDGRPRQGWTVSFHNGKSNLSWYLGKERQDLAKAEDFMKLRTVLKGEALQLWTKLVEHGDHKPDSQQ